MPFMFEPDLFKCFLVLSIDLGVDSPFCDVAISRQNGNGPNISVYYLSYVREQLRMKVQLSNFSK